ncbi:AraC family ligand binding domain-containing protein [Bacterioplanoides sp.]|uniref:AraC family ligand binding domain-containing protein n=1 Tax=Bacterioplanoides sp. TaxID=2066072 RepID=UPI003B00DA32
MSLSSQHPKSEYAHYHSSEAMGGLELLEARFENHTFTRHTHESYTIGVIEDGAQGFYRTGDNHVAPAGTVILVNADEVHSGHSETQGGWAYRALYPKPEQLEQLNTDLNQSTGVSGAPYFPNAVVQDPFLAQQLYQLLALDRQKTSLLMQESVLYEVLRTLILRYGKSRPTEALPGRAKKQLTLVKEYLDDYPDSDISLEGLANLAGLSPYHLNRSFKKAFGIPPHAYQIQARLRRAKTLLRQGMPVADVAVATGFHDQSHLHRNFRKALGVPPGRYQKAFS